MNQTKINDHWPVNISFLIMPYAGIYAFFDSCQHFID